MRGAQCAVVIPSCRSVTAERLRRIPEGVDIYVVSDTEAPIRAVRPGMQVFDLDFQRKVMGPDYDLIPRRTSACRNFGFFYIWKHTGHEYVISIDDDVEPGEGFLDHFAHLGETRALETACGVKWLNTIDLLEGCEGLYPRGFPFAERVADRPAALVRTRTRVACHMGLWDGVLDTHAIDKHLFDDYRRQRAGLRARRHYTRVGTQRDPTKFPLSSMNFGFVRDALPLMYQMPMPAEFVDRYPLGRYEDIWAGYIAESLIALRDEAITVGAPIVRHVKQGGTLDHELHVEHYGTLLSPYLFGVVDELVPHVRAASYLEMYAHLCDLVLTRGDAVRTRLAIPASFWRYIESCFHAIGRWCEPQLNSGSRRVFPARISGA